MSDDFEAIIKFWLGDVSAPSEALKRRGKIWFSADAELDWEIASRFGGLIEPGIDEVVERWQGTPRGRLGLIILLDQFPRNIYRGTEMAFAFDAKSLELSQGGIDAGMDQLLKPLERMFFYMPFQHAENPEIQQRAVALFEALALSSPDHQREFFHYSLGFAREHQELIARFGRFPHRNRLLGRESTAEEIAYLEGGGKTFGQ